MAETARSSIDVGSILADTYTIEALIGRGGMGSVFRASHARLPGKAVAIKVLHSDVVDPEVLARFRREAEIASRLGHPNIVQVNDFNVLPDGTPYLVLEYLEGETLAARLARGPLALDQAMAIVRQVGSALQAAHRDGIVHRDLKPGNIFLVPNEVEGHQGDVAKLLDFGISKMRGSDTVKTQESSLLGTPQYMAPEQATGNHANVDARTDIFALGTIVYEMFAGRPAFAGGSIAEVVFRVVYEQPVPLRELAPSVPEPLVGAVAQAMSKSAEERFTTVSGFVTALTGTPLAVSSRPPSSVPRGEVPRLRTAPGASASAGNAAAGAAGAAGAASAVASAAANVPVAAGAATVPSSPAIVVPPSTRPASPATPPSVPVAETVASADTKRRLAEASGGGGGGGARTWLVIVPLVAAAGAAAMYLAMRGGGGGDAGAGSGSSGSTGGDTGSGSLIAQAPVDAHVDVAIDAAVALDAAAIAAHVDASVAAAPHDAAVAHPSADAAAAVELGAGSAGDHAAAGQHLTSAEQALNRGDESTASRLANSVVDDPDAGAGQKNEAHAILGVMACRFHNSLQDAQIELRRIPAGTKAHARVIHECHAAGIDLD